MKKQLAILLLVIIMVATGTVASFAKDASTVLMINGEKHPEEPLKMEGGYYFNLRDLAEIFGYRYHANPADNIVSLFYAGASMESYSPSDQTFAKGSYYGSVNFTYDNGTVYKGGFKNGNFYGSGDIVYANGTKYKGNFDENGKLHGQGTYTALNGDTYKGYFVENTIEGYGTYTYANGDRITGRFSNGKVVGDVNVKYGSGGSDNSVRWSRPIQSVNIYDATFNPNLYNGSADLVYSNGVSFKGSVSNNTFNGSGKIDYPDGASYSGNFVQDKKEGKGVFTFVNGESYNGYFADDKFHGLGKYSYINGDEYNGMFENGKMHGEGTYSYVNGDKFEGYWENGVRHTVGFKGVGRNPERSYGLLTIHKDNSKSGKTERQLQMYREGELIGRMTP